MDPVKSPVKVPVKVPVKSLAPLWMRSDIAAIAETTSDAVRESLGWALTEKDQKGRCGKEEGRDRMEVKGMEEEVQLDER